MLEGISDTGDTIIRAADIAQSLFEGWRVLGQSSKSLVVVIDRQYACRLGH